MHQSPKGSKFCPRICTYSIFITEILLAIWYKWPWNQNKDRNKMVSHPNLTHRSWCKKTKKVNCDTKLQNITTLLYSSRSHLPHKTMHLAIVNHLQLRSIPKLELHIAWFTAKDTPFHIHLIKKVLFIRVTLTTRTIIVKI